MPDPRYSYGYRDSLQEKARVLSTAEYLSAKTSYVSGARDCLSLAYVS